MQEQAKQRLVRLIVNLGSKVIIDPDPNSIKDLGIPISAFLAGGSSFFLTADVIKERSLLFKQILQEKDWASKFSEEYISKALEPLIVKAAKRETNEKIAEYFDQLVTQLDSYSQERTVLLPIASILMEVDTLTIGKFILRHMTDAQVTEFANSIEAALTESEKILSQKEQSIFIWNKFIFEHMRDRVYAEFSLIAEPQRAVERTELECQQLFDLLLYSIALVDADKYNFTIEFLREASYVAHHYTSITYTGSFEVDLISRNINSSSYFTITSEVVERMRQIGVFEVGEILKKEIGRTKFENVLIRSIHWFANALTQIENGNKLLSLITSIEMFFSTRTTDRIANTVAEGTALILGSNFEERKQLKQKIKDFYDKRSRVSHEGQKEILNT